MNNKQFINDFNKLCTPYEYTPSILKSHDRIVVFGDLHGDLKLTKKLLIKSRVAVYKDKKNNKFTWIGNDTCVIQVGDQIDRCRVTDKPCNDPTATQNDEASDIIIMEIFNDLSIQARKTGGYVISLLGNHEILNAMGDMRYVSYYGTEQFKHYVDSANPTAKFTNGTEARIHAFKPGNDYGKMMGCTRHAAVIVGSYLFVHAGIIDALVDKLHLKDRNDIEEINIKIKQWLLGTLQQKYVNNIITCSPISPFWTRFIGNIPPNTPMTDIRCLDNIPNVLKIFNVNSIIIGHTPHVFTDGVGMYKTCGDGIVNVDNAASAAFDKFDTKHKYKKIRQPQYAVIRNDKDIKFRSV